MGCSPWGRKESDTTERLHFHLSLSCIGEGNGNPLQCSCLENPRDRGAWWAAVYGVVQSRTRLKRLSSSSSGLILGEKSDWWVCFTFLYLPGLCECVHFFFLLLNVRFFKFCNSLQFSKVSHMISCNPIIPPFSHSNPILSLRVCVCVCVYTTSSLFSHLSMDI